MFGSRKPRSDKGVRRKPEDSGEITLSLRLHPEKDKAIFDKVQEWRTRDPNLTVKDIFVWAVSSAAGLPVQFKGAGGITPEDLERLRDEIFSRMEEMGVNGGSKNSSKAGGRKKKTTPQERDFLSNLLCGFADEDETEPIES